MGSSNLFYALHLVRMAFAKLFLVQGLDKFGEWQFPRLIFSIRIFGKAFGAQAQFSCHLNVDIGQSEFLPNVNPWVKFVWNTGFLCHGALLRPFDDAGEWGRPAIQYPAFVTAVVTIS